MTGTAPAYLPHNMATRWNEVHAVWPTMTIYGIGNATHAAGKSDHNPDSTGKVHAIDVMTLTDASFVIDGQPAHVWLQAWLKRYNDDLEYWIHDRIIYRRKDGFKGIPYTGTDPHTNHFHISGKHGAFHAAFNTESGYDLTAEKLTPPPVMEDDMPTTEEIAQAVYDKLAVTLPANYNKPGSKISLPSSQSSEMKYILDIRDNTVLIMSALADSAKMEATIQSALQTVSTASNVTPDMLKDALLAALKELAAPADATP